MARLFPFREAKRGPSSVESFSVCEVKGAAGVPVRFLVGRLAKGAEPLEEGSPIATGERLIPSLAADDHHALSAILEEVTLKGPPDWEAQGARGWNLGTNGFRKRVEEVVEELDVRPLCAVPSEDSLTAVVPLSEPGLKLAPFHRGLLELATFDEATFLRLVAQYARVYDVEEDLRTQPGRQAALSRLASLATGHHAFLLVLPQGRAKILRVRQALELGTIRAVPRNPTLRSLDLVLLESLVLRTVLGVQEPDRADHPNIAAIGTFDMLVDHVLEGRLQAGFALNPPPAWEVRAVMEVKQKLPSQTLRIEPTLPAEALGSIHP